MVYFYSNVEELNKKYIFMYTAEGMVEIRGGHVGKWKKPKNNNRRTLSGHHLPIIDLP